MRSLIRMAGGSSAFRIRFELWICADLRKPTEQDTRSGAVRGGREDEQKMNESFTKDERG
jgi:hypothetical protein